MLLHRVLVTVLTCLSYTLLAASPGLAAPPAPRGELRIVDPSPVNWVSVTLNVFEHLWESDADVKLAPRLATGWRWVDDRTLEVTLRRAVKFHNGEAFDAQIVKLNWDENIGLKQPDPVAFMSFQPGSRIDIVDPLTVRFIFPEPDGAALFKLMDMHIGSRQFYREAVRRLVAENPDAPALAKQERDVSVLFLDISGYTRLAETLAPDALNAMVEAYFSSFLDAIRAADGDINETAGDGFMAIFQDADPPAHALKAVRTALDLLALTERLNEGNPRHPLSIHMGVNSGVALVGTTRFDGLRGSRWTFTASGPATNLAARLAGVAEFGQLLAGPETVRRIGRGYQTERIGRERLKNIADAIEIHRILADA